MSSRTLIVFLAAALALAGMAGAQPSGAAAGGERLVLPELDPAKIRLADERRAMRGAVPHYAVAQEVAVDPWSHGAWEPLGGEKARWRLRVASPGALSLNLAFDRYRMPEGGRLTIASADGRYRIGPFTAADNEDHGELWTPPVPGEELVLELTLPVARLEELELGLAKVHHGYAGFGEPPPKAGDCHVDVACSEAETWSDAARSVALVSVAGVRFCSGFLLNNTALDGRPLFVTAYHCGVGFENAASVVVMWNHQRRSCDGAVTADEENGYLESFQSGAYLRASYRPSDVVLLELDDLPEPRFGVYYAGWDARPIEPEGTAVVHHPNTGHKRLALDFDRAPAGWHLSPGRDAKGDHLRVVDWDLGTTEGGSSGAPLFNLDKRVVGQLHGGYAACGDERSDWFGRLSAAWVGRGWSGRRLSDWLDPLASGAKVLDGLDGADVPAGE